MTLQQAIEKGLLRARTPVQLSDADTAVVLKEYMLAWLAAEIKEASYECKTKEEQSRITNLGRHLVGLRAFKV